jgi:hypothetical protein
VAAPVEYWMDAGALARNNLTYIVCATPARDLAVAEERMHDL